MGTRRLNRIVFAPVVTIRVFTKEVSRTLDGERRGSTVVGFMVFLGWLTSVPRRDFLLAKLLGDKSIADAAKFRCRLNDGRIVLVVEVAVERD
jgi:hypothetical protein